MNVGRQRVFALQGTWGSTYRRGKISVLDREGLEAASCECYAKATREYKRFAKDIRNL